MGVNRIDGARLWSDLEALAGIIDPGSTPFTRRAFGPAYAEARHWLVSRMEEAGLVVRRDAVGTVIGSTPRTRSPPPIVLGSHIDTVEGGGRFDGALGVLAALEVARTLADSGATLNHPLEIVDFTAEEPNPYGSSCIGSRAWAGTLNQQLLERTDADGETLADALPRAGGDPHRIDEARRAPGSVAAYLELHIEQGPVLEREGASVGIVTGIVSIRRVSVILSGHASHAGTTPMDVRQDALPAAAELVLAVERTARASGGELVATVGKARIEPNAPNVIPGRAELSLEVRSLSHRLCDAALDEVGQTARAAAKARGLNVDIRERSRLDTVTADERIVQALERGCTSIGVRAMQLPSWGGHDTSLISLIAPVGMIFAPSRGGLSHHPDEWTSPDQCAEAADALLAGLRELDRSFAADRG